jgi:hypothetical protein
MLEPVVIQVVSVTTLLTTIHIYIMCISFKFVFPFDENVYCETYRIKLCSSYFLN